MKDYVIKDNKKLRKGFTTGTCAAAAAQGALVKCLSGNALPQSVIRTPKGIELTISLCHEAVPTEFFRKWSDSVEAGDFQRTSAPEAEWKPISICGVKKFSGDDPDVTNGIMVYAGVSCRRTKSPAETQQLMKELEQQYPNVVIAMEQDICVVIDGGVGVGRVTKPGLACSVGQAAINPTPRAMIGDAVRQAAEKLDFQGVIAVEIVIPDGMETAKKTYNPRLGIEGGISVLGTTGIVEPMSEQALIDTIKVEMNMRCAQGAEYLLITPGNYGETFLRGTLNLGDIYTVKCSNFLGETLDYAVEKGVKGLLLVSHIGKLVKVAGGIMNTHSKYGDARMEILAAHAALQGADNDAVRQIMECITTDDAIAVLDRAGLRQKTIDSVLCKVRYHLEHRVRQEIKTEAVMFSNQYGLLGQTEGAEELVHLL